MTASFASQLFDSLDDYHEWVLLQLFDTSMRLVTYSRQATKDLQPTLQRVAEAEAEKCTKSLMECGVLHRFSRLADYKSLNAQAITAEILSAHNQLALSWFDEDRTFEPSAITVNYSMPSLSEVARRLEQKQSEPVEQACTELGVSLADIGIALGNSDEELTSFVLRFSKSKKITAPKLGKCPINGKAQLYRLFDIMKNLHDFSPLSRAENRRITKHLTKVQREPRAATKK